jgi:AraC-like DNA-binding protein
MFSLEGQPWETKANDAFRKTSSIEVWGQILQPLVFKVPGRSKVFGIRLHPAAAAFFIKEDISLFNDRVLDLTSVVGNSIGDVHAQLQDAEDADQRVQIMDAYLLKKIGDKSKTLDKIDLVQQVMTEMSRKDFFDNIENVAERYGITARYLQKVFVQQTGLTPKLYSKINRFQNSLVLLGQQDQSLTSVAYSSGYFDQSHFIREFKSFTGFSPSRFKLAGSTAILASPNK